jgi:O-antigen/teichoic acid export membrane protein
MSLAKKTLALSLGQGFNSIVTVLSAMVMSRLLTHDELATYRQTFLAYDLLGVILGLGVQDAIYYFLPTESKRSRGLVLDGILLLFAMGLVFLAFLVCGGSRALAFQFSNPELADHLLYLTMLPVISMPAALISAVLVTQNRVVWLSVYTVASNSFILLSIIVSCLFTQDTETLVLTRVLTTSLTCAVALQLIWRSMPVDDWHPSLASMKRLMLFGLPLGAASVFGTLQTSTDRLLVSSFCLPEDFAIYTNGAIEIPFIGIFTGAIAKVILPELRQSIATGNKRMALELFRKSAEKSAVLLIPATVFLMVVAESVMIFLYSDKYVDSATPFRIYLLLLPARIVIYGSFMVALGLNRTVLFRTACAAICNLILGYFLVQWMGQAGAASATVATTYLIAILWSLIAIQKAVPCSFYEILPYRQIAEIGLISLISVIPVVAFTSMTSLQSSGLIVLFSSVIFGAFFLALATCLKNVAILDVLGLTRQLMLGKIVGR